MARTIRDGDYAYGNEWNAMVAGYLGSGLQAGGEVTQHAPPGMSVDVAAGVVRLNSSTVTLNASSALAIAAAHATLPRYDIVVGDDEGVASVVTGTPAAAPIAPDIPANRVLLAIVNVPAAAVTVVTANITDARVLLRQQFTTTPQWASVVAGIAQTGIVSGGAVTPNGPADMFIDITAGSARLLGTAFTWTLAANLAVTAADATFPRYDIVTVSSAGAKVVTAGTPALNPVMPAIPASSVLLAVLRIAPGSTAVTANDINDARVTLGTASSTFNTPANNATLAIRSVNKFGSSNGTLNLPSSSGAGFVAGDAITVVAGPGNFNNITINATGDSIDGIVSAARVRFSGKVSAGGILELLGGSAMVFQITFTWDGTGWLVTNANCVYYVDGNNAGNPVANAHGPFHDTFDHAVFNIIAAVDSVTGSGDFPFSNLPIMWANPALINFGAASVTSGTATAEIHAYPGTTNTAPTLGTVGSMPYVFWGVITIAALPNVAGNISGAGISNSVTVANLTSTTTTTAKRLCVGVDSAGSVRFVVCSGVAVENIDTGITAVAGDQLGFVICPRGATNALYVVNYTQGLAARVNKTIAMGGVQGLGVVNLFKAATAAANTVTWTSGGVRVSA